MASLICPNCGKDNPDFLDDCQFCQTPLRREAKLNIGENPTKKDTGELEPILPDWLREARQQARDSAEEEAAKEATKPKIQKAEPQDLLAGLAFQADDDEEVPDWLAAINPIKEEKKKIEPSKAAEEEPSDFFAQFNQPVKPSTPSAPAEPQDEALPWMTGSADQTPADELAGGWLAPETDAGGALEDNAWLNNLGTPEQTAVSATPAEPEDLNWLHDLEASAKQPATPALQSDSDMDWMQNLSSGSSAQEDLSWLNNLGGTPTQAEPAASQPEDLGWLNNLGGLPLSEPPAPAQPAAPKEDLDWLSNLGGTPAQSFEQPASSQPSASQEDLSWLNNLDSTPAPSKPTTPPQEDLSWLNNLGGTPAQSVEQPASFQPSASQEDLSWLNNLDNTPTPSTPAPSQAEDLSWLNNLGGTPAQSFEQPASSQPSASQDDLSWLNNLGATPAQDEPAAAQEDLDWLSNLGGTPAQSFEQPASSQPSASQEDLSWLNNLGGTPAQAEPAAAQEGMDWLSNLGGTPAQSFEQPAPAADDLGWLNDLGGIPAPAESIFEEPAQPSQPQTPDWLKDVEGQLDTQAQPLSPARTAPLSPEAAANIPDWLKDATESAASSIPPLSAVQPSRPAPREEPIDELMQGFDAISRAPTFDQTQGTPASVDQNLYETPATSAEDVDALFAVDMPDWLSQQPETTSDVPAEAGNFPAMSNDALSPVDLPSWVQAMRPVESVISETSAASASQNTEREGPLAGLRGVIPFAPIGSAQRPKAISLKLQASEEQQASAALLEQIINGEATARPVKSTPLMASQRSLRWALSGLFLIILSLVIGLGTQSLPVLVSNTDMQDIQNLSSTILGLPDGASVLVVMDYEPAVVGELEGTAGPLLDQLTILKHPTYTFISMSSNGPALVERLLTNTGINQPAPDGQGYQADVNYFNAGYLPGGSTGIQGFVQDPQAVMPAVNTSLFSNFAAVIILTDHAESGLVWIEQMELAKQADPALVNTPLFVAASAQAGPLLAPYVSSQQVTTLINGLPEAARYENINNTRPGIARAYWDAFGAGLSLAVVAIVLGSLWGVFANIRARRAEAEQG